jgi:hypothetical protein
MANKTTYKTEIANEICEWLMSGKSLRSYCDQPGKTPFTTVLGWLRDDGNEEFRTKYAHAREMQAEVLADELKDIADQNKPDQLVLAHDKMKIETRQWIASKLLPKKYGNKLEFEDVSKNQRKLVIVTTDKDIE